MRGVSLAVGRGEPDAVQRHLPGGQEAMIGMAVVDAPALFIADEPTTALGATVQRQVPRLVKCIQQADGVALLFTSHDITVVGQVCDRVLRVLRGGADSGIRAARLADVHSDVLLLELPDLAAAHGDRPTGVIARLARYDTEHGTNLSRRCEHGWTPSAT